MPSTSTTRGVPPGTSAAIARRHCASVSWRHCAASAAAAPSDAAHDRRVSAVQQRGMRSDRRTLSCADELLWILAAHDGDGIGTFELLTGLMHRLPKAFTALAKTMNQMCDDLSVRLGMKDIALAGERFAQRVELFKWWGAHLVAAQRGAKVLPLRGKAEAAA